MSFQVTTAFVQQYTTNVNLLLQQSGSRFRNAVTEGSYTGKAAKAVEQIGAVVAQKRTTRHSDTPLISTPHDARWVFPVDYDWADLIDDVDKLRMLIDPQSPYAINGANSIGRAMDDEIVSAFFGTSKTGENGTTNTAFPAGNVVALGTSGMTVKKLRAAKRILMANEVDLDTDPLYCGI
ncbi:MAG: phage capsid protein, partial [Mariprofundaceae bacterium]